MGEEATERDEWSRRVRDARVGHLGTLTLAGRPHVVVCCFALVDDVLYSAVDRKPKSTRALRRLDNIRANPAATLLVDHYDDDWTQLWWVRLDGTARVLNDGDERDRALGALASKYPQYVVAPPDGPVIALDITHWRTWP
ncbi:MAG TPA: TIGR03668 family PPOX class F420-dependent oxidoreductase [Acidimicrobiales bacterium]|jgi:PPOX class probable F420-dependent enzyme|nr:TIGR03668 family PPOX class F420-dependent oxidoreductase [Acidimicrobiales bacterium]